MAGSAGAVVAPCCWRPDAFCSRFLVRAVGFCSLLDGRCEGDASRAAGGLVSESDGRRPAMRKWKLARGESGRLCGARSNTIPPAVCCGKALALLPFPTKFSWHDHRAGPLFLLGGPHLLERGPTKNGVIDSLEHFRSGGTTTSIFMVDVRGPCVAVSALAALWKPGAAQESPVAV